MSSVVDLNMDEAKVVFDKIHEVIGKKSLNVKTKVQGSLQSSEAALIAKILEVRHHTRYACICIMLNFLN